MRLLRMTTRRWMIAIVAVSLALALAGLYRRRLAYLSLVGLHQRREWETLSDEQYLEDTMIRWVRSLRKVKTFSETPEIGRDPEARAKYHAAMARKYRRAARYPWLPVEPDPPEPE